MPQELENMKGKKVDVTVIEVDAAFRKIVLSMGRADQYKPRSADVG